MIGDLIRLVGVSCRCKVGVTAAERARRQTILIDAALAVDAAAAAAQDDVREAVDYQVVETLIRTEAEGREYGLIETMAERLAAAVLKAHPRVRALTVSVRKTPVAMPKTRAVIVEIRRARAA